MASPADVVIGPGTVYVAPLGEAFPAIDTAPAGNWRDIGDFTEDGATFAVDRTITKVIGDKSIDPIKAYQLNREARLEANLIDTQLENIAVALGGDDANIVVDAGPPAIESWVPETDLVDWALLVRLPGGANNGKTRDIQVQRVISEGATAMQMNGTDAVSVGITFTAMKPASGDTYKFVDET